MIIWRRFMTIQSKLSWRPDVLKTSHILICGERNYKAHDLMVDV